MKLLLRISNYFISVWAEAKKVVWPSRQEVVRQTTVVIISVIIIGIIFGLVDFGLSKLIEILLKWRS